MPKGMEGTHMLPMSIRKKWFALSALSLVVLGGCGSVEQPASEQGIPQPQGCDSGHRMRYSLPEGLEWYQISAWDKPIRESESRSHPY